MMQFYRHTFWSGLIAITVLLLVIAKIAAEKIYGLNIPNSATIALITLYAISLPLMKRQRYAALPSNAPRIFNSLRLIEAAGIVLGIGLILLLTNTPPFKFGLASPLFLITFVSIAGSCSAIGSAYEWNYRRLLKYYRVSDQPV